MTNHPLVEVALYIPHARKGEQITGVLVETDVGPGLLRTYEAPLPYRPMLKFESPIGVEEGVVDYLLHGGYTTFDLYVPSKNVAWRTTPSLLRQGRYGYFDGRSQYFLHSDHWSPLTVPLPYKVIHFPVDVLLTEQGELTERRHGNRACSLQ